MAGLNIKLLSACAVAVLLGAAGAQEPESEPPAAIDLTQPPVILSAPGDAHLEPPPEEHEAVLEAVVTGGQTDWRLPDLGSSLRKEREEARDPNQRIAVELVPLYDPGEQESTADFLAPEVEVMRGVGMIKIFNLRIGGRRRPE